VRKVNRYPSLSRPSEAGATPAVLVPVDTAADRLTDHFWPAADCTERTRAAMRAQYRRVMEGEGAGFPGTEGADHG
jgi:hypothetical protein